MQPSAFKACYSDWKLIKTRGVVQVVMEVPLAEADAAYKVLGGMPDVSREQWFGVAALKLAQTEKEAMPNNPAQSEHDNARPQPNSAPAGAKREKGTEGYVRRNWDSLLPSTQAGIRSHDAIFEAFLKETRPDDWHEASNADECLKMICGILSKTELVKDERARVIWHQLDSAFQAWEAKERVGA